MIRVMIVASGVATRAGLRALLMDDPRIQVIGEAATPGDIEAGEADMDVIVWSAGESADLETNLSTPLSNIGGGETTALLVIHPEPKIILPLARLGRHAWGLLSPEASREELIAAVEAVYEGLMVTDPAWLKHLTSNQTLTPVEDNDMVETLTERELEILQLMALGLTNKQIALKLGISAHTVKFHVSAIFSKMGTTNRTETVKLGLKKGLILL